jgi:broad specificity phosphatase PhoE
VVDVVLARDGETGTSAHRLVGGDAPLSAQGRELGRQLSSLPIDVCLTSAARRTRETARVALAHRDVPCEILPELAEITFGSFSGRPLGEYRDWIAAHPPSAAPGGGESRVDTLRRFGSAFRALLARPESHVLVVAHGLALRAAADERPEPAVTGIAYGSWIRLDREQLVHSVARLEAWCKDPHW